VLRLDVADTPEHDGGDLFGLQRLAVRGRAHARLDAGRRGILDSLRGLTVAPDPHFWLSARGTQGADP
jgi:hypothetical protein